MTRGVCTFPSCGRDLHGNGLCKTHRQQQRRGRPVTALRPAPGSMPLAERFWGQVDRGEGCWEWRGTLRPHGYGVISINNRNEYAHRVSWELTNGATIPAGMVIDHICLNIRCVNPDHLRVTTQKRNAEYRPRGRTPVPVSGIRGVYPMRDKWMARVKHAGTVYNLGHYADKEEAGRVAIAKRQELFQFPEYQGEIQ